MSESTQMTEHERKQRIITCTERVMEKLGEADKSVSDLALYLIQEYPIDGKASKIIKKNMDIIDLLFDGIKVKVKKSNTLV